MASFKKWEEIFFPMPWGHIAGKQWGRRSGKPILAVHGWQENCNTFDPLSAYFPEDWFVIAIDLSGHRKSSNLPDGVLYNYFGFVMQIKRVVDFLGWKEFSFIGHSAGGGIGILFSCVYPKRIKCLVLLEFIKLVSKSGCDKDLLVNLRKMFNQWEKIEKFKGRNPTPKSFPISKAIELIINVSFGSMNEESAKIMLPRGTKINDSNEVVFSRDAALGVLPYAFYASEFYETILSDFTSNLMIINAIDGAKPEEEEIGEKFIEVYRRVCPHFEFLTVEGTHHAHMIHPDKVSAPMVEFINKYHNETSQLSKL